MDEPIPIRRSKREGRRVSRRTGWIIAIAVVFVAILFVGRLGGLYVDWLWYQSVGQTGVFSTRLIAQVTLLVIAALAFLAVFLINTSLALRLASRQDVVARLLGWMEPNQGIGLLRIFSICAGLVLALMVGANVGGAWDVVLRYMNPTSFGTADPIFGQDVSFFVFTLPMYGVLHGWYMATIFLSLIATLAIYGIKLILPQVPLQQQAVEDRQPVKPLRLDFGRAVKGHVLALIALLVLGFATQSWLNTYELVLSPEGLVFGAGYADVHARLPMLWVSTAAGVLFALLLLVSISRRGYRLPLVGLGIWIGIALLGVIYPAMIQRFEVQPSELDKERPYIEHNIKLTNQAYALDRISELEYPAQDEVSPAEVQANPGTIKNIRLWDPQPLLDTYNQIQSIRLYYDFLDVDVDRYMIDGEQRQVMLSARELSPNKLASQAQTWINRRLQFTHGYGVAMSPVNEVTPEGLPELFLRDVPPTGKIPLSRPEIYFGENTNEYVIVKTDTPEFDYPKGDDNVYVRYAGGTGVEVGSFLRRLFFAWQFGDSNLILTGSIAPDSKVLYNRNITERAQMIAPFLAYDRDPYVVVANGRLYWIQDAYTHTDRYPYSQPMDVGGTSNYIRNSVKVVTDAYDGSISFYTADATDPIVGAYARIFPDLFRPLESMPKELRAHLRYPEDLFKVQADLYRTYHMKDPRVFYNKEDLWGIPNEIYLDKEVPMQPYYVNMRLAGQEREEFTLILPYTPPAKNNMITWLAARCDGDNYGKLVAYKYPKDKLIYGPMQIEARINQDPVISSQLTLWNQSGSRVIRGNLMVIPIGQSNLYVEPIYLQAEQTKLPEMKRVVLATGGKVVMEPTVNAALQQLFAGRVPPTTPTTPGPGPSKQELSDKAKALLDRLNKLQEEIKSVESDLRDLLGSLGE